MLGVATLGHFLSAAIATPVVHILAAAAKGIVRELLQSTTSIEKKIDRMLTEPLQTSMRTFIEVISAAPKDRTELEESYRRLDVAFDDLNKAYTYASPEERLLLRLYMTLIAALKRGGGAFVRLYLNELASVASEAREAATQADEEARHAEHVLNWLTNKPVSARAQDGWMAGREYQAEHLDRLLARSRRLRIGAEELETFCRFVTRLAQIGLSGIVNEAHAC